MSDPGGWKSRSNHGLSHPSDACAGKLHLVHPEEEVGDPLISSDRYFPEILFLQTRRQAAGIDDLNPVIVNLDHQARAAHSVVPVNDGVGNGLAKGFNGNLVDVLAIYAFDFASAVEVFLEEEESSVELGQQIILDVLMVEDMNPVFSLEGDHCHLRLKDELAGIFGEEEHAGIGDLVVMGYIEACEDIVSDNFFDSDIRFLEKTLDLIPGYILPRNLPVNHFFKRDKFVFPEHDPQLMVAHLLRRPVEPSEVARAAAVRFFVALRHVDDDEVFHLPDLGLYRRAAITSQGIDAGLQVVRQLFAADGLVIPYAEDDDAPFRIREGRHIFNNAGAEVLLEFDGKPLSLLDDHVDSLGIDHFDILPILLCVQRPADRKERLDRLLLLQFPLNLRGAWFIPSGPGRTRRLQPLPSSWMWTVLRSAGRSCPWIRSASDHS